MKMTLRWFFVIMLIMFIWGSFFPVTKGISPNLHPLTLAVMRYLFAVIPMFPFYLHEARRKGHPTFRDLLGISGIGFLGITGFAVFLFIGIRYTTATASSILSNTQPIFVTLLSPLFTSERFTLRQFVGTMVGFVGMVIVVTGGSIQALDLADAALMGNLLCVGAALLISLYYILIKRYSSRYGSTVPTFLSMVSGGMLLLLIALSQGADLRGVATLSTIDWIGVLYLGVVTTALVYIIHNRAIAVVGVIPTVSMKFMIPVFGVLLSMLMLGERPSFGTVAGMLIVAAAILLIYYPRRALSAEQGVERV